MDKFLLLLILMVTSPIWLPMLFFGFLFLLMFFWMFVLWFFGFPMYIKVKEKKIGYIRWFKFYKV